MKTDENADIRPWVHISEALARAFDDMWREAGIDTDDEEEPEEEAA